MTVGAKGKGRSIDIGMEEAAFDKLVSDLIEHGNYFEDRWQLTGVAADCRQAARELRNQRAKLIVLLSSSVSNLNRSES
jgi:hypothetical protein